MDMIINCGILIDGTGREPMENCSIGIENGKIIDIVETLKASNREKIVDWSNFFVTPGFFDCHDHITEDWVNKYDSEESRKIFSSFLGTKNCLDALKSGITTLRDTGSKYAINVKLRDAIKNDLIEGPDIIAAGNRIARTGWPKWPVCREADGIDEVRKAVRQEQKGGADFIKLMITGISEKKTTPTYSEEEIKAGIVEAHSLGLSVGVHGYGGPAVTYAIKCGVDTVEHGSQLTDNNYEEMIRKNTSLVITLSVLRNFKNLSELSPLYDEEVKGELKKTYMELVSLIKKARDYGILFAIGSDHQRDLTGKVDRKSVV